MSNIYKNNFDQSSTGINIEFIGYYDNCASQGYFNDNAARIGKDFYFWNDWRNLKTPSTIGEVATIRPELKRAELINILFEVDEWTNPGGLTVSELKTAILASDNLQILNDRDASEWFKLRKDWQIVTTRGYSQGDYCRVLVNLGGLRKVWGAQPDFNALCAEIDHVFWDSPIYAQLTINGQEFNYDEAGLDPYDWQRSEFIEYIQRESGIDRSKFEGLIPDQLEYN